VPCEDEELNRAEAVMAVVLLSLQRSSTRTYTPILYDFPTISSGSTIRKDAFDGRSYFIIARAALSNI
jgi:hypothetical protein